MLKFRVETICIENADNEPGFCLISVMEENGTSWIEIRGNEEKPEYPLILESKKDVDQLALYLKSLLS